MHFIQSVIVRQIYLYSHNRSFRQITVAMPAATAPITNDVPLHIPNTARNMSRINLAGVFPIGLAL